MVAFSDVEPSVAIETPRKGASLTHTGPRIKERSRSAQPRAGRQALAGAARFAGVVLMLSALGIWILSGPLWDAEMMLVRLAISVLFMSLGLMLLHAGRGRVRDEVHLDTRAQQLRHVQRGRDGIARTRQTFAMSDLGEITVDDDVLILRSRAGDIVMELSGLSQEQLHLMKRELRKL